MNNKRNQLVHFPYHYETLIINISRVSHFKEILLTLLLGSPIQTLKMKKMEIDLFL